MKISDIAKAAGVSPGTVSNALNNRKGIGKEKREMIIKIAEEMGYFADEQNKNSLNKSIRFIVYKRHGYVVADTPFFAELIEGIERECRIQGYELLISHITHGEQDQSDVQGIIKGRMVSGVILLATEMQDGDLAPFRNLNVPIIILDSYFKNEKFDYVLMNNAKGAYEAVNYLIENGHRSIGYLCSSVYINNFCHRKKGYIEALEDSNIAVEEKNLFRLESTLEGSYRDMKKILKNNNINLPTAFFADNDIIAFGALRALGEVGKELLDKISIVGFDDMPFCEISSPRLTTIKVHKQEIGKAAVKRVIEKIENRDYVRQKIEIDTELVIRDSVKNIGT
jgi:DNA-binding LacI/PurR family transcriptional regulator